MKELEIKCFCLGMWMTNSYVVSLKGSGNCLIIDAGFEPAELAGYVRSGGMTPEMLVFTHAHLDHIAGADELSDAYPGLCTALHESERLFLTDPKLNLSASCGMSITARDASRYLTDGEILELDGLEFLVIHTPGHSPGGICLYQEENGVLFSGDTLFQGSVGRYDFPTSNGRDLMASIKDRLLPLPDETLVYPGHGNPTTIGAERRSNPFL